jgi:hypothetical protein
MTGENVNHTKQDSQKMAARRTDEGDRTEGGAIMRAAEIILCILSIPGVYALAQRTGVPLRWQLSSQTPAQPPAKGKRIVPAQTRIVIAASTVLDGKGGVLHDTRIVIEGSKIVALDTKADPKAGPMDYDLRGLTVLPGWIDAHVHITWSFGRDGKNSDLE